MDKLSILLLKLEKINDLKYEDCLYLLSQVEAAFSLLTTEIKKHLLTTRKPAQDVKAILSLIIQLIDSNEKQWEHETRVREQQTAEAAVDARKQNYVRVQLKDQIDSLFSSLGDNRTITTFSKIEKTKVGVE